MKDSHGSHGRSRGSERCLLHCFCVVSAFFFVVPISRAENVRIGNRYVSAEFSDDGLVLRSEATRHAFVPAFKLPWPVSTVEKRRVDDPTWGGGESIVLEHTSGWTTMLSVYDSSPFVQVHTRVVNRADAPFEANTFPYAELEVDCEVATDKVRVVGTGGLTTAAKSQGSYTFSAIADPASRHGIVCAWLTHERGVGVFFPSVVDGKIVVRSQIDFGHYRVDSGKTRPTETLLIGYFDDTRLGLEAYADSIARQYAIKLAEKPGVYCTWYHAGASNEKALADNTRFASKHLRPFGLSVMQIDDKWQKMLPADAKIKTTGPIKVFAAANQNYPGGMAKTAQAIALSGMTAGIWFMPFAGNLQNPYFKSDIYAKNPDGTPFHDARWSGTCIDLSHPEGEAFVRRRVRRMHDWGYRYFKIDGMHTGAPSYNIYVNTSYRNQDFGLARLHDPYATHAEAYRKGLRILREEAPGTFVLGCNVSQNMRSMGPAFGMIDAMRIGPDNGAAGRGRWNQVVLGAWHGTNLYFLNQRVWHNDPDPVYVRASNPIERARWMCSWIAVTGSLHTSSEQYDTLPVERLQLLKRCLPTHRLPARPVDYLETDRPRIWLVSNDRMHLVGLFNWQEKEADEVRYDLGKMGLDGTRSYVAFDCWKNRFVKPFSSELRQTLEPGTCRILAVRSVEDRPQLISTSRHITQGLMDVESERWDAVNSTLRGRSRVVAGDEYEMRIVLPPDGPWRIRRAKAAEQELAPGRENGDPRDTLRLTFVPESTGTVDWRISFERP